MIQPGKNLTFGKKAEISLKVGFFGVGKKFVPLMCYFWVYIHHICFYDSAKTACFEKISFSSYIRKFSWPIRLQDFLNFNITKTIWGIKFLFRMQLIFHGSYSLIIKFSLDLVKHALSAQKKIGNTYFE